MKTTPNLGLNVPELTDSWDTKTFFEDNFNTIDEKAVQKDPDTGYINSNDIYDFPSGRTLNESLDIVASLGDGRVSVPVSPTSAGMSGSWAVNSTHFYICYATNQWRRVAISTW